MHATEGDLKVFDDQRLTGATLGQKGANVVGAGAHLALVWPGEPTPYGADDTLGRDQKNDEEQHADEQQTVFGEERQELRQQHHDDGADDGPENGFHASDDDDQQEEDGLE